MTTADWAIHGYDAAQSRSNRGETTIGPASVAHLAARWRFRGDAPLSPPVTSGRRVYLCDSAGSVVALDEATGAPRWTARLAGFTQPAHLGRLGIGGPPAVADDRVYLADTLARVWALDAASGVVVWKRIVGDLDQGDTIWTTPAPHRGLLLVGVSSFDGRGAERGRIVALDARSGEAAWSSPAGEPYDGDIYGSVAVDPGGERVYYATGSPPLGPRAAAEMGRINSVVAYDAAARQVLWTYPRTPPAGRHREYLTSVNLIGVPASGGRGAALVGVGRQDGRYVALDARTGAPRWQMVTGYEGEIWGDAAVAAGRVFVGATIHPGGSSAGEVLALDAATGKVVWAVQLPPPSEVTAHVSEANGVVFVGDGDGWLHMLDRASGRRLARHRLPERLARGAVVANGAVLAPVAAPENALLSLVPSGTPAR